MELNIDYDDYCYFDQVVKKLQSVYTNCLQCTLLHSDWSLSTKPLCGRTELKRLKSIAAKKREKNIVIVVGGGGVAQW